MKYLRYIFFKCTIKRTQRVSKDLIILFKPKKKKRKTCCDYCGSSNCDTALQVMFSILEPCQEFSISIIFSSENHLLSHLILFSTMGPSDPLKNATYKLFSTFNPFFRNQFATFPNDFPNSLCYLHLNA